MRGYSYHRGAVPPYADTQSDEWFADFLERCRHGRKREAVLNERVRATDLWLWDQRAYDAKTAECLAIIRTYRGRGRGPKGSLPVSIPRGSAA